MAWSTNKHTSVHGLASNTARSDLVKLAGKRHEEEGQLKHYRHDQCDEKQMVIVVEWRAHLDLDCSTACRTPIAAAACCAAAAVESRLTDPPYTRAAQEV